MIQNERVLCDFVKKYIGWEEHYNGFRPLESDVRFFSHYMKREAKSPFNFEVRIRSGMSVKAFEDLWVRWGRYSDEKTLEIVYAQFCALKLIIEDINGDGRKVDDKDIRAFVQYIEQYDDFTVSNYVSDFVGCSRSCGFVIKELNEIMGKETQENEL